MLEAGSRVELTLDSMAYGGDAVGRHRGQAVFVPLGLPGERVRARVTEPHRTYCRAAIEAVLEASPRRIKPECPAFGRCGGCQWQMVDYPGQLEFKRQVLAETLSRLGGLEVPEIETIGHSSGWGYRNKAQFPAAPGPGGPSLGYYQRGSHRLVEIEGCPILDRTLSASWPAIHRAVSASGLKGYDEKSRGGQLRHLVLRSSRSQQKAMLSLVTKAPPLPDGLAEALAAADPSISSVWQNVNPNPGNTILGKKWFRLWGQEHLSEKMVGVGLRLSPGSFLQVNLEVAEKVYGTLDGWMELDGTETVLDVYSGVGSIAMMLAGSAAKVIGIEENSSAVDDAAASAAANGIGNCLFLAGRAEDLMGGVEACHAAVVDPPRQGLRPEVVSALARLSPGRLAYLSCDPATLARDLKGLAAAGYRLARLCLADMFPQTYHIETLALMKRGDG
jgi:23S rRNA (uracil1939-C5)-methyltransferase